MYIKLYLFAKINIYNSFSNHYLNVLNIFSLVFIRFMVSELLPRALCVSLPFLQHLFQVQIKTILLVLVSMIHCSTLQVLISSILVMVFHLYLLPLSLTEPTTSLGLVLSIWPSSPETRWHFSSAQSQSLQSQNLLFTLLGRDATLSSCPGFWIRFPPSLLKASSSLNVLPTFGTTFVNVFHREIFFALQSSRKKYMVFLKVTVLFLIFTLPWKYYGRN